MTDKERDMRIIANIQNLIVDAQFPGSHAKAIYEAQEWLVEKYKELEQVNV